jgi:glycine cleavage system P protein (glycine dehydrogenase) subunit 1
MELARQNHARAAYARERLAGRKGITLPHAAPFFNEFVVRLPVRAEEAVETLGAKGIAAGVPLSRYDAGRDRDLLVCVTETNPRAEIDRLADELGRLA